MAFNDYIYKYRIYSDLNLKMLAQNSLYFSTPAQFNDPFDGLFYIEDDVDTEEYAETVKSLRLRLGLTENECNSVINAGTDANKEIKPQVKDGWKEYSHIVREQLLHQCGVCCFSLIPDHVLLWAHCADGGKGFCVEFDDREDILLNGKEVIYQDVRPIIKQ
jgi:hypothetical protein